jgi:hypothetical protein
LSDDAIAKVQPQPGVTYRVTYNYADGKRRETIAQFVGLETDPVVMNPDTGDHDKVSMHFILTTNVIRDLARQKEYTIEAPPNEPVHFHLWPEDLVNIEGLTPAPIDGQPSVGTEWDNRH